MSFEIVLHLAGKVVLSLGDLQCAKESWLFFHQLALFVKVIFNVFNNTLCFLIIEHIGIALGADLTPVKRNDERFLDCVLFNSVFFHIYSHSLSAHNRLLNSHITLSLRGRQGVKWEFSHRSLSLATN